MPKHRSTPMNSECPTDLWDRLEEALARQAQCLRQGNWRDFESALDQSRDLVDQILQDGQAMGACSEESRKERLRRSYGQLMLMAAARQHTLDQQIQRLRCNRRAIQVYQQHRG